MLDAREEKFEPFELFGKVVLFTDGRIDPKTVPEGLYLYSLRHGDDDSIPLTVEKHVTVNHFGNIISKREIPFPDGEEYAEIPGDDDWGYLSDMDEMTVDDYFKLKSDEPMSDERKIEPFLLMLI